MTRPLRQVAVFCGSSRGAVPAHARAAADLGGVLASRRIELVYGGGHVGLMGVLADAVLEAGGAVHGVITRALADREVAHDGLTTLDVVETMHERKAAMSDRADAFVMLPGGFGTLDEFFEALTWTQLGVHDKACGVLDVEGYFAPLLAFLDRMEALAFVRPEHRAAVCTAAEPERLLDLVERWAPPPAGTDKWLDPVDR